MDFTFSADQDALRDAVRAFLAAEAPKEYVRRMAEHDDTGITPELWRRIVDLGWTGSARARSARRARPRASIDAVVVQEEMGRALFPGPYFSSAIVATLAARALGLDDRLAALAAGTERGTVALDEAGHGDPIERVRVRAIGPRLAPPARRRQADGDGRALRRLGARPGPHARRPADVPRRERRRRTRSPRRRSTSPASSPASSSTRRRALLVGPPGDHAHLWRRIADDAAVLLAAELIGVSEAANALALDYAQAREVFGKPLSKFQVTRHKAVDMLREIEIARVAVHYAAWASEVDAPDREIAAAMAKAQAASAANYVTAECIQIHGGVGYTWENDAHLFLRRAKVDDLLMGAQGWQRERVADEYFATL